MINMPRHLFSDAIEKILRHSFFSSKQNPFLYYMAMHKNVSMRKRVSFANHYLHVEGKLFKIIFHDGEF